MTGRSSSSFDCVVVGEQSMLVQCCEALLGRGHEIRAVVAENRRIVQWCSQRNLLRVDTVSQLRDRAETAAFDYLFSITNLKILPEWLLSRARRMSINFHDGPLPRYAGLNAPVWAMINGEKEHGITWHQIAKGIDTGPILVGRVFPIMEDDTAFSLNARCYEAGVEAFPELLAGLEDETLELRAQDMSQRTYFGLDHRPKSAALLDWRQPARTVQGLVRALDFGPYANPVALAKVDLGESIVVARLAEVADGTPGLSPGTIQAFTDSTLTVRCLDDALHILRVTDFNGSPVNIAEMLSRRGLDVGDPLPAMSEAALASLDEAVGEIAKHEDFWRHRMMMMEPPDLPFGSSITGTGKSFIWRRLVSPEPHTSTEWVATLGLLFARLTGKPDFCAAYVPATIAAKPEWFSRFFASIVPLRLAVQLESDFAALVTATEQSVVETERKGSYFRDLFARDHGLAAVADCKTFPLRIVRGQNIDENDAASFAAGAALTVVVPDRGDTIGLLAQSGSITEDNLSRLVDCLSVLIRNIPNSRTVPVGDLDILSSDDRQKLLAFSNGGSSSLPTAGVTCAHQLFERQVTVTPDRDACIFEHRILSYQQLNESANRLSRHLQSLGVKPGDLVGVMVERSPEMLMALYAVHKTGAAYVPLDPLYPQDRLAYMAEDAGLRTIITQRAFRSVTRVSRQVVLEDIEGKLDSYDSSNLNLDIQPDSLAYVIYTSGSTGKPKGVMIEHRNLTNFLDGMDQRLDSTPGVWLAVTSISFDISVLELFWTLTRGFTIVLYADERRQKSRPVSVRRDRRSIEFGLFYWNVSGDENMHDPDKYRLLMEGAKFADANDFNAVWNPERHFESFGGLFPNPAVTCAALAAVTRNVALRAGSCVVPLHSPIRIAEEWAVVDNLSNGRVGISIAAGWAAPDFAIKPENFANAKQVMFESAEIVRRLWRGETVPFPGPKGEVKVRTLPRPLQNELPIWVTTAGNVETFEQAGKFGANLLTHLLGQSLQQVAEKVRVYRNAWTAAGHAGKGVVTLMLHTFVGPDQEAVEGIVRQPLKDYLKSAMFLVKAAAWQFPTFKQMSSETGKTLDQFFADASGQDMDDLLEFAFQRYFHSSGLFGTPDSCAQMVDQVEGADIDEIACLIDFGIDTDVVLEHLPYLNELRSATQRIETAAAPDVDYSLPALLQRHQVTHFQCTPSMAAMLAADSQAQPGLATLRQMMVGGEAFPPELARTLRSTVRGRVTNMYGPTETTIWSAIGDIENGNTANYVSVGRPLPGQTVYILDERQRPLPPGLIGELVIGGSGVGRGYWQRPDLTASRFLADPFSDGSRIYRTGDRARYLPDGRVECLGRGDQQVKIRGYRVELGEIEALLRSDEEVSEGVVLLREDTPGDKRLVAYVVTVNGNDINEERIKSALKQQLPDFMTPTVFVRMTEMPLTPNGKIDRKALPAPKHAEQRTQAPAAPTSDVEAMISDIWQRALGLEKVGTRDNFFDLGGHSLLIVQVLKELREKIAQPIQMTDLFRHTTIEALARHITGASTTAAAQTRGTARADARRAARNRRQ